MNSTLLFDHFSLDPRFGGRDHLGGKFAVLTPTLPIIMMIMSAKGENLKAATTMKITRN
jgi:hypothetical protein